MEQFCIACDQLYPPLLCQHFAIEKSPLAKLKSQLGLLCGHGGFHPVALKRFLIIIVRGLLIGGSLIGVNIFQRVDSLNREYFFLAVARM